MALPQTSIRIPKPSVVFFFPVQKLWWHFPFPPTFVKGKMTEKNITPTITEGAVTPLPARAYPWITFDEVGEPSMISFSVEFQNCRVHHYNGQMFINALNHPLKFVIADCVSPHIWPGNPELALSTVCYPVQMEKSIARFAGEEVMFCTTGYDLSSQFQIFAEDVFRFVQMMRSEGRKYGERIHIITSLIAVQAIEATGGKYGNALFVSPSTTVETARLDNDRKLIDPTKWNTHLNSYTDRSSGRNLRQKRYMCASP